ncbi:unnamed protein product [Zymoseptoria tritici ST99CH_1E4]|uniref:MATE efflux family protein n=1 Tax=Zymoseptoria tritici ST99CH_1E4 TaxID=1276532 RepID=A0A2H1GJ34_ZYMTR|nr:unnamed protein product [Zymoseptoria tritici ST99CH_1E4]
MAARRLSTTERQPLLGESVNRTTDSSSTLSKDGPRINASELVSQLELRVLLRYSGPLIPSYLLQYSFTIIVTLVASQLSTDELAGCSLGMTTSNIIGYAIFEGMATALDTLCSQAYGSGRFSDVGMAMIRFLVFVHLVAIPIGGLWLFSEAILRRLVPSEELAVHAGSFLRYSLIGLPGFASFEAGKRFMQSQGQFTAGLWSLLICLPINIGLTYALVLKADMRVAGAALAASLTNLIRPLILIGYAFITDRTTLQCWPTTKEIRSSWSKDWSPMCRLALSGTVMTLSEWLSFEILTFALTYLGNAPLAAQTFLSTTATLVWHIPFSISIAGSTRIGQLVGGGLTHGSALRIMKMYAAIFAFNGILNVALGIGIVAIMLRFLINDQEVADIVLVNLPFLGVFLFCDAIVLWPHSVVRGIGWQSIAAYTTLGAAYLYGVPLALFLELGSPRLGVSGLWIGLASAVFFTCIIEASVVWTRLRRYPGKCFDEYEGASEEQTLIDT